MSVSLIDLQGLNVAFTRLSEKFKAFWTFHQFLEALHKAFFGDAPAYQIRFQELYAQIQNLTVAMTVQEPADVLESVQRLDKRLGQVQRALLDDDQTIAPNYIRRFFERARTDEERLLLSLLRFYFYVPQASHDALDKMDFLLTVVGSRRALNNGVYMARFPQELVKLFTSLLALAPRDPLDKAEVRSLVHALGLLKKDIEECDRFEDLAEKKTLENLRTLKHRVARYYYDVEVLSAIVEANLAAKNRFQSLFEEEERRLLASSQHLLELEKAIAQNPRYRGEDLKAEFQRFHEYRADFKRQHAERGIRHSDVRQLSASIDNLLKKIRSLPTDVAPKGSGGNVRARVSGASGGSGTRRGSQEASASSEAVALAAKAGADPLTAEQASKVLYAVDGANRTAAGRAGTSKGLTRLGLEPWEIRAARRILREELSPDAWTRTRDRLFFDAASLRLKLDEEAQALKTSTGKNPVTAERLAGCGRCLMKAQEADRGFRQLLEEAGEAPPDIVGEINRSRFRLLRSFAGLWLLHDKQVNR